MKRRCVVFIDGRNLFHAARREFGYEWPTFDVGKLSRLLAVRVKSARFYAGVPVASVDPWWYAFWANKCALMQSCGIKTITRPLRVHTDGANAILSEKGIDLRIGLDMVRATHAGEMDLMILVSDDVGFLEAIRECRLIAHNAGRRLRVASAYPDGSHHRQGIYQTEWIPISAIEYGACLDPRDYRPSDRQLHALTRLNPSPEREFQNLLQWPTRRFRTK